MNHNVVRAAELHRRKIFVKRQGLSDIVGGGPDENDGPTRSTPTGPASTPPAGGPGGVPGRESSSTSTTPTSTRTPQTTPPATTSTTVDNPLTELFPPTTTSRTSTSTSSTERTTRTTSSSSSTTSSSSSTSLTSSSSSIRTTSSTSSSTSTQTTPTANLGPTTARGASTVFRTLDTSSFGSATGSGSAASATSSNTPTGATSTAAIVGGVIGAIVGIAAVCIFVAFLIRRLRKRRDEDHFSAAQFRRSAVLLDDEFATDGRAGQIQRGNSIGSNRGGLGAGGGYGTSLRPPTMIERHMASTPAAPPVSYGYGQQYDQYGQYPDYGDQQQYSFQPGQVVTPMNDSMAYGVAVGQSGSPPPPGQYYDDHNTYLNRQPSGGHAAYDNYTAHGAYVDMNRMPSPPAHVTSPPPATASPPLAAAPTNAAATGPSEGQSSALASAQAAAQAGNSQPVQRAPSANAGQKRPDTVVSTIYNPDDAYGGM